MKCAARLDAGQRSMMLGCGALAGLTGSRVRCCRSEELSEARQFDLGRVQSRLDRSRENLGVARGDPSTDFGGVKLELFALGNGFATHVVDDIRHGVGDEAESA